MSKNDPAERTVRDIRRKTRKQYTAEEKIRIVVSGLRGLDNMKIQAYLTDAAINLKRLAAALLAILWAIWTARAAGQDPLHAHHVHTLRTSLRVAAAT